MRDVVATKYYLAYIRTLETGGEPQHRCLAAATGAKQREEFRRIYRQAEFSKNGLLVEALGNTLKLKDRGHWDCWRTITGAFDFARHAAASEANPICDWLLSIFYSRF